MSEPRKKRKRPPRDEEARLDRLIKAEFGKGPEDYPSPEIWSQVREAKRLNLLYPGRYVVYRKHYIKEGKSRLLVRCEVFHVSRSLLAINRWMDKLPPEKQREVRMTYIDKPGVLFM